MANRKQRNTWQFRWLLTVLNCLLISLAIAGEDFYALLRIERDADTAQIKKAFRKMSLEYHPDKNPGDEEAAEKFTKINRALEVLTDDTKRQIYDQQGEDEVDRYERGGNNRMKGPENKLDFKVTLDDLYNGKKQDFTVKRNVYCTECKGSGAEGGKTKTCTKCNGQGTVRVTQNMGFMQMQMQQPCGKCSGKGRMNEKNCVTCKGKKVVQEPKTLTIDVVKGMANNEKVVYERMGEQVPDMLQGDIIMQIKCDQHWMFKRVQDNLYMNVNVSLKEALFGAEGEFTHMDGHKFTVASTFNKVTQPFSWLVIPKEGMPVKNQDGIFGDLHVKMLVDFPTKLNAKQKELVKLIFPEDASSPAPKIEQQ